MTHPTPTAEQREAAHELIERIAGMIINGVAYNPENLDAENLAAGVRNWLPELSALLADREAAATRAALDWVRSRGMAIYADERNELSDRRAIRAFIDKIQDEGKVRVLLSIPGEEPTR